MTRDYYLYPDSLCPNCKKGKVKELQVWNNKNPFLFCSFCDFKSQLTNTWYKHEIKRI